MDPPHYMGNHLGEEQSGRADGIRLVTGVEGDQYPVNQRHTVDCQRRNARGGSDIPPSVRWSGWGCWKHPPKRTFAAYAAAALRGAARKNGAALHPQNGVGNIRFAKADRKVERCRSRIIERCEADEMRPAACPHRAAGHCVH
jgi:hypothetical protein